MRASRVVYGVVAGVLVVAGVVLPRYLANRSVPDLGGTVVVPAQSGPSTQTPVPPPVTTSNGAGQVSPPPARTAGVDDDDGPDDPDGPDDSDDNG